MFNAVTRKIRRARVEEYAYCVKIFTKTLVWKREYDVKL